MIAQRKSFLLYWVKEYLQGSPEELKRLTSNARKMVVDRFDQQFIWGELLKVYQSLSH